ncbi:uncharacterized protein AB675_219 [Cyphellophora attinorum]|uniref:Uncharacterized protein n=1 Tax=Cyphellophora attinorum TaxID=1664694 RepID=A0A0N0NK64_9EURO|nr:uncharacterized protein AB675_219 [Phialophora attinorum]KPI37781.1 hypothetical protein AB675_219 [Phialophora attinorum]
MPEAAAADSPIHSDASSDASDNDSQHEHASGEKSGKNYSIKDKECPYCRQKFTSSSLGRHLDQYIHKKKPDGIHNVDEIRRLRGTITRRTARNSKKNGSGDRPSTGNGSGRPSPAPLPPSHLIEVPADINAVPTSGVQSSINRLTWHSTGVITDPASIDPSPSSTTTHANTLPLPNTTHGSPSRKRNFSTYTSDLTTNSTSPTALADTARALELSLREVLDSLRAATKHVATPPSPFDFDLPSQTYPSLILQLLPVPPTLNQTAPFSTIQSVPFGPPGPDQLTPLRNRLTYNIDRWKWSALRLAQRTTSNIADEAPSSPPKPTRTPPPPSNTSTPATKTGYRRAEIEEKMETLEQEASQLKQQVEYLSRCQWPREMALWPPERTTYNRKMRDEIRLINLQRPTQSVLRQSASRPDTHGPSFGLNEQPYTAAQNTHTTYDVHDVEDDDGDAPGMATENVNTRGDKWDFDKLVNKWRSHVKEDRSRRAPFTSATHHSASYPGAAGIANGARTASPLQAVDPGRGVGDGSPVVAAAGGSGTGSGNAEMDGLGIAPPGHANLRRDKPLFGKGNDVRIVSDW